MNVHVKKSIPIEYIWVVKAYQKVRRGGKAVGIDDESWQAFDKDLQRNLYLIWNRMSSGSYFPQPVKEVEIPKKDGRMRKLGIPTLRDRIAQQVIKHYMEIQVDILFHKNSYGYRPLKGAKQALKQVRSNCLQQDWVIDLDIRKFFDEIDHELMLKAVSHVMPENWVKMYVQRWLEMSKVKKDGTIEESNGKGTPQGGVISPLLSNLYLHFTLDLWLSKNFPECNFVRYADDLTIHCNTKEQAELVLAKVKDRLKTTKLSINESKTKIAYCKDYRRKQKHPNISFEFLGFSFKPQKMLSKFKSTTYTGFGCEISKSNQKRITSLIRDEPTLKFTSIDIELIASKLNSKLRGWINYYDIYGRRKLRRILLQLDKRLLYWLKKKHKTGLRHANRILKTIKQRSPHLFYHWKKGYA